MGERVEPKELAKAKKLAKPKELAKPVATAEEILLALTQILRGEVEAKPGEVLRAAELLGRRYGLFVEQGGAAEAAVILDDMG